MPTYTPPAGNAVDFELEEYTEPAGNAVDFFLTNTPVVTDVQPRTFSNGDLVEVTGNKFGNTQGNGKVELGDNHQHNLANKVQQNIDHWEDLVIRFITNKGSLPNGQVFVFVTNDDGETNDPPPPEDPEDLDTELIPEQGAAGFSGSFKGQSIEKQLEIIYAVLADHTVPRSSRSSDYLLQRIGRIRGINLTSGSRSLENNLILLYENIAEESWTSERLSAELILRRIIAAL